MQGNGKRWRGVLAVMCLLHNTGWCWDDLGPGEAGWDLPPASFASTQNLPGNHAAGLQHGQDNDLLLRQEGLEQLAVVAQWGSNNSTFIFQQGSSLGAWVTQVGTGNQVEISQRGTLHGVRVLQEGDFQQARIVQTH